MSCETNKVKSTGLQAFWELEEQTHVTCVADDNSSLHDTYLKAEDGEGNKHIFVMKVAAAETTATLAGYTKVEVSFAEDATAAAVATALETAVDALDGYHAKADGETVTITNAVAGECDPMEDGATTFATGFEVTQCQVGGKLEVGLTQGDVELSGFEPEVQDVTAHQTGTIPVASIYKGVAPTLTLTLLETDKEKLKQLFASIGAEHTQDGVTGFGAGTGKIGTLMNTLARRLRLHPATLSESNKTEDIIYWKAVLIPSSIVYSTETQDTFSVTFKVYPDMEKPQNVNLIYFGDWSKLAPVVVEGA